MSVQAIRSLLLAIAILAWLPGCALLGNNKLEQCQGESERLLADYRQERDRADRLADQNQQINARVTELEQRIASLSQPQNQRLATRPAADSGLPEPNSADTPLMEPQQPQSPALPPSTAGIVPPPEPLRPLPDPWRKASR